MAALEVLWLRSLLTEIGFLPLTVPIIWCENQSAIALASNPKYHSGTKHIELDIHFLREKVANKCLQIQYVPSSDQTADILTNPYLLSLFIIFVPSSTFFLMLSLRGNVRNIQNDSEYSRMFEMIPVCSSCYPCFWCW